MHVRDSADFEDREFLSLHLDDVAGYGLVGYDLPIRPFCEAFLRRSPSLVFVCCRLKIPTLFDSLDEVMTSIKPGKQPTLPWAEVLVRFLVTGTGRCMSVKFLARRTEFFTAEQVDLVDCGAQAHL